ncbi:MAG: hypothetical protein WC748_08075 [Legionellales bacterium]|jgi:hypothetical protein
MKSFNHKQLTEQQLQKQLTQNATGLSNVLNNFPYLSYVGTTNYILCFEVCDKFNLKEARILLETSLATLVEKSAKEVHFHCTPYIPSTLDLFRQKFLALLAMANFNDENLMRRMLPFAAHFLKVNLEYEVFTEAYDPTSDGFIENIAKYLPAENKNFANMIIFIRDNFLFFERGFSFRAKYETGAAIKSGMIVSILKHFSIQQCRKTFAIFEEHHSFNLLVDAAFLDKDGLKEARDKLPQKFQEFYFFIQNIGNCQDEIQKNEIYREKREILIAATNSISKANRILSIKKLSVENKNDFFKNILAKVDINSAEDFTDFIKFLTVSQCKLLCQKLADDNKFTETLYLKNYSPKPSLEGFGAVMSALAAAEISEAQEIAYDALESGLLKLIQEIQQNNNNPIYDENDSTFADGFKERHPLYHRIQTAHQNGDYIFKPLSSLLRVRAYEKLKSHLVKLFDARDKISTNHVIFYICLHFLPQGKTQEICEFFKNESVAIRKFQPRDFVWHMRWSQPEKIPAIYKVFVSDLIKSTADFNIILPSQERVALKFLLNELKDKINEKIQNMQDLKVIVDYVDNEVRVDAKNSICTLLHARIGQLINGSSHINWLFKDLNDGIKILIINILKLAIYQFKENLPRAIKNNFRFSYGQYSDLIKFLDSIDMNNITSITLYEFFKHMDTDPFLQKTWQVASRPKSETQRLIIDLKLMTSNAPSESFSSLDIDTYPYLFNKLS